jgi:hypothetical protein
VVMLDRQPTTFEDSQTMWQDNGSIMSDPLFAGGVNSRTSYEWYSCQQWMTQCTVDFVLPNPCKCCSLCYHFRMWTLNNFIVFNCLVSLFIACSII